MRKSKIPDDYLQSNYKPLDDIAEFVNLSKTHLSKDTLYYPLFDVRGGIDLLRTSQRRGLRFGKVEAKPSLRRFTVGCSGPIQGFVDIYKHLEQDIYMIKFFDLELDDAIFIEHSPTEIKKSFVYTDGSFEQRVVSVV